MADCIYDYFGQYVPDQRAQLAMMFGAFLEAGTPCGPFPDQIGGGPGRGPFQIEAGAGGSHAGAISESAARQAGPSVQHMAAAYQSCAQSVPNTGDVMQDYAGIVQCAERGTGYSPNRLSEAWQQLSSFNPAQGNAASSWWDKIKSGLGAGLLGVPGIGPFGGINAITGGASNVLSGLENVGKFFGWLTNLFTAPGFWIRLLLIIGGTAFVLIGVSRLAGVSAVPVPIPA